MTAPPCLPDPPSADVPTASIQCAEVWGGNQSIYAPVVLPGLRGVVFSRSCSGGRGGDVHYLSMCGSGLLARVCLADVAGHGERVSEVGRQAHRLLRRHVNWPDHRRLLRRLNVSLERRGLDALMTAAVLTYYAPSQRLSFSYAGHPPAWYFPARQGTWRRLLLAPETSAGRRSSVLVDGPLAVRPDAVFSRSRLRAEQGDRVLLITDGVLEAHDGSFRHFGAAGVERVLHDHRGRDVRALSAALLGGLAAHCATAEFTHDDVSFLLLEVTAPPEGPALWHVLKNRVLRPLGTTRSEAAARSPSV